MSLANSLTQGARVTLTNNRHALSRARTLESETSPKLTDCSVKESPSPASAEVARDALADTETMSAEELIAWAGKRYGRDLVLSSSFGADSAVMLHLVTSILPGIRVLFVDTGYLFPETYRFVDDLQKKFDFELHVASPLMTAARQEALYGNLWEQGDEGVHRYLAMNKVEPMERALRETGARAWLAGIRSEQTEHRSGLDRVGLKDGRAKIHPILSWTRTEVNEYMAAHDLPTHPLVAQGYRSIGDRHSTIPVLPGDDERSGRLLGTQKECGLHLSESQRKSWDASRL